MAARTVFDIAPGTSMAGAPMASFVAPVTGALLITASASADETLRVNVLGRTAQVLGGGTTLGTNQVSTFVLHVVRGRTYEVTFSAGAGVVEMLVGVIETDQVA